MRQVLAERVYRMGVQTVELRNGRYFLTLRNRTYTSVQEVPRETALRYLAKMRRDAQREPTAFLSAQLDEQGDLS